MEGSLVYQQRKKRALFLIVAIGNATVWDPGEDIHRDTENISYI